MITILSVFTGGQTPQERRDAYQPPKKRQGPRRSPPARGDSVEISDAAYSLAHPDEANPPGGKG